MLFILLELCVLSLRRGHANLLYIVPNLTDDPRRESEHQVMDYITLNCGKTSVGIIFVRPVSVLKFWISEGLTQAESSFRTLDFGISDADSGFRKGKEGFWTSQRKQILDFGRVEFSCSCP